MTYPPTRRLSTPEFIALIAMMFATLAFSIDAMLPALPEIAQELTPQTPNRAMLIIVAFVFGMGLGTLVTGPLADSFGRKRVILFGAGLYCLAAVAAWWAPTLELVLAARVVQGLGVAAPRVACLAIIRDLYKGRDMAKITSFVFMVFSLVPAIAPAAGQVIIWFFDWRAIFLAFVLFMGLCILWLALRQPETLPPEKRRPFRFDDLREGFGEALGNRIVQVSILAQSLCFAMLITTLQITQPAMEQTYGRGDEFPAWFALIALLAASASIINASLVQKVGMRGMVRAMLMIQLCLSGGALFYWSMDGTASNVSFGIFVLWTLGIFFQAGLTLGNLNAIALEPMGHRAGMTASIVGAIATTLAALGSIPIAQAFDGHPAPVAGAVLIAALAALGIMRFMPPPPEG